MVRFSSHNLSKTTYPKGLNAESKPESSVMTVNFICQLGWVTGCPDIWLNNLGTVRSCLDEINI